MNNQLPCRRMLHEGEWVCVNGHTGCHYNDGQDTCTAEGDEESPLQEGPQYESAHSEPTG